MIRTEREACVEGDNDLKRQQVHELEKHWTSVSAVCYLLLCEELGNQ